jgi:hypothetical protein
MQQISCNCLEIVSFSLTFYIYDNCVFSLNAVVHGDSFVLLNSAFDRDLIGLVYFMLCYFLLYKSIF